MTELELGNYEFFPCEDERVGILKDLEESEMTGEEVKKRLEDMLKKIRERKSKVKKRV